MTRQWRWCRVFTAFWITKSTLFPHAAIPIGPILESIIDNREFLRSRLGLEESRHALDSLIVESPPLAKWKNHTVSRVRWPVLSHPAPQTSAMASLWGEGLYIQSDAARPLVIIVPDASEGPRRASPVGRPHITTKGRCPTRWSVPG